MEIDILIALISILLFINKRLIISKSSFKIAKYNAVS